MEKKHLPFLKVTGDYYEVGTQIGTFMRSSIQSGIQRMREGDLPYGRPWEQVQHMSRLFAAHTEEVYPQYMKELKGVAEGAEVDFEDAFIWMCEELWEQPLWQGDPHWLKGCTDFIARGEATVSGHTLLAHTNDVSPECEEELVILQVKAGDDPEFLGVSIGGMGYSAGFNAAGISMTGNQLDSNDVRIGVPRLFVVRQILAARRLGEAMDACLLPQRASSYNNIIGDPYGEVYCMEGSATDMEPIYIEENILAHANHYVSAPMRKFEIRRSEIGGSVLRYHRAFHLLRDHYGQITPELLQTLLADHANYPSSICKHDGDSVTVFSLVIDLNTLECWIGRGRPCEAEFVRYVLDPWEPPAEWKKMGGAA